MFVRKIAAKKSLAPTLALVLGLALPGSAAWSQTYNARAVHITVNASAAAASIAGVQSSIVAMPILSAPALSPAAALAAPAINSAKVPDAGVAKIAKALPAGSSSREVLSHLANTLGASRAGAPSGDEASAITKVFDGSKAGEAAVEAVASGGSLGKEIFEALKKMPESTQRDEAIAAVPGASFSKMESSDIAAILSLQSRGYVQTWTDPYGDDPDHGYWDPLNALPKEAWLRLDRRHAYALANAWVKKNDRKRADLLLGLWLETRNQ